MLGLASSFDPPPGAYVVLPLALLALALYARNRDVHDAHRLLSRGPTARVIGLLVIAFGLMFAYMFAAQPIAEALAGRRTVQVHRAALVVPGLLIYAGMILLIAGRRSHEIFIARPGEPTSPLQRGVIAGGLVMAFALTLGLDPLFRSLGYRIFR